ncbi:Tryptophan--tRNA ligase 2 [Candidatus Rhabdochlamydia oedothoracis]|uniref:Tryptophan--tRNA ligase n=1 Tax=Candidatus Rhabdochlamydia oedothoracis TaxID=2720720 RepID=A0ABX8V0F5_9BACT|nr:MULTISPECIES: tryptophan--tRNA ligase [Rhabdochlamydia]KAG6559781.1 Tryptophan--tRNA ligase 2 [Candidatus Rhabdochlamydia sp. W815]MCL6755666.1 tryptophan--tRNA ligase [Candidatus Rhabdochlamydia oedothoracis]QYF48664.1 Tryptophan--tRNA ligase 2 [Candidatus Rhabdochlamydia oedothoracis]
MIGAQLLVKQIVLTGDRPTGPLHIGHYVGSLKSRLDLQKTCRQFVMIADAQALTDNAKDPKKVRENILQVALDYLAVGIDSEQTTIFIQSLIPPLFELTSYFLNLVTWNRLKHNPTIKREILQKGYEKNIAAGFMIYPVSQAADITAFKADIVPVGEDQLPMIEQTNELVRHFNHAYNTNVFTSCKALTTKVSRLPGLDGKEKMSKSLNNAIFLSDSPELISKKIKGMYSDPNHTRVEDPGNVEASPVFTYLDCFDPDLSFLEDLKQKYRKGGLGDAVVKKRLNEVLQAFLEPIRKRREHYAQDPREVMNILQKGTDRANLVTHQTLIEVRQAMGLDYFSSSSSSSS